MPIVGPLTKAPCLVTGNLNTLLGATAQLGFADFLLGNLGTGTVPRVLGTGTFPAVKQTAQADSSGIIRISLWGNDVIDPANSVYFATFRDQNRNEVGPVTLSITGTNFNLNTAVPLTSIFPPVLTQVGNVNRIQATLGTPLVTGDFLLTGWGAGASITNLIGTDTAFQITVQAGTAPAMTPTILLTYHDGTWGLAPIGYASMEGGTGVVTDIATATTAISLTLTYDGLPVAGKTYVISALSIGHP